MGIKRFRPYTNGVRHAALPDFSELTKGKPEKSLLEPIKGYWRAKFLRPYHVQAPWRRA